MRKKPYFPLAKPEGSISPPCRLLTKKATGASADTGTCVQEKGFETIERYTELDELLIPKDCVVLLECMSNLVANEMFREGGFHPEVAEKITEGVKNLLSQAKHVVIVTNEIFSDGILYEEESEQYKKELGQINQKLAEMAEEVVEVVYGIPVWHKGGKEA